MRLRPGLIVPPTYQADRKDERRVTWLELFYDLVFVVAVGQTSTFLYNDLNWMGLLKTAGIFVVVWWAWVGQTFYLTRFDSDDLIHRLLTMVQMFAVASLALSVRTALGEGSTQFAVSYIVIRSILVFEYLRAGYYIPKARDLTNRYSIGFTRAVCVWVISLFVPPPWRFALWGLGVIVDYATPNVSSALGAKIPPHISHLPERFGLFTIIVIGESVLSTVLGLEKAGMTLASLVTAGLSWLLAFAIWWAYFDGIRAAEARAPSDRISSFTYRVWLYTHLPLTMGIVITAISIKSILAHDTTHPMPFEQGTIFLLGNVVSMVAMYLIFRTNPKIVCTSVLRRFLWPHLVVTLATMSLALVLPVIPEVLLVALVLTAWVCHVALTLRADNSFSAREIHHELDALEIEEA